MRLCLNMIVRDEAAIIERCLRSVIPHISCWAITDTGSVDQTPDIIRTVLANIPGRLTIRPFTNFSESRNAAIDDAKILGFDYYLFLDADHQLVADPGWHKTLSHDAYLLLQKSSDFSFRNVRLLRKGVNGHYIGATHEHFNVQGDVWAIDEAYVVDRADGYNRQDKLKRDLALLDREVRRHPNASNIYYLAQTYRDLGNHKAAAPLYQRRASMDDGEEAWRAQLEYSRCLLAQKKDSKFVHNSLIALSYRPNRAEPLYDLSRFFIDEEKYETAFMFTKLGLEKPKPTQEIGVVDDWIYDYGLKECYSVLAARFLPARSEGRRICDSLSLNKNIPYNPRISARNNIYHYCDPIDSLLASWQPRKLSFEPPTGYNQMNCSITRLGDKLFAAERTISYSVDGYGNYQTVENEHSRNFLLSIDPEDLKDSLVCELHAPKDFPHPENNRAIGWEDLRLFEWKKDLWVIGCVCEQNKMGMAEQYIARIPSNGYLTEWRRLTPIATPLRNEKNWMPLVNGDLRLVYSCDPVKVFSWDAHKLLMENKTRTAADHFRGGSQLIPYKNGYLAIIHSTATINKVNWYYHRFVTFTNDLKLDNISIPFIFRPGDEQRRAYQYAMGLCHHPDDKRLIVSYQTDECRSWLGTFEEGELSNIMGDHE